MITREKPVRHEVTRESAAAHVALEHVPGDRRVRKESKAELFQRIVAGTFRTTEWIICYCKETGLWYRLDGKHTAIIFADEATPLTDRDGNPFYVFLIKYTVDAMSEMVEINSEIDEGGNKRSSRDGNRIHIATVPELKGALDQTIMLCVKGLAMATTEMGYSVIRDKNHGRLLTGQNNFCQFVRDLMEPPKRCPRPNFLRKNAVAAAIYKNWTQNPMAAKEFWFAVRDGSATIQEDGTVSPEKRLENWLREQVKTSQSKAHHRLTGNKCATMWKQWFKIHHSPQKRQGNGVSGWPSRRAAKKGN